ncbi:MAG: DUF72 domain-containing protein [Acidimicrobiales bacterium]|nr:DUF72 domain-containing protein [Acidimicrobiales bacterium]
MRRAQPAGVARVGCSGYDYPDWRGVVYPPGLARQRWFERYAELFDTVELNATFYGLPTPAVVGSWRARAPEGFVYAVKLSRFGTHRKRLIDPGSWLPVFLERLEPLGPVLGPVLVQLPPRWRADPARLDAFLAAAPRRLRWAVEVRDPRWLCDPVFEVLRRHRAALVHHDLLPDHPDVVTAGFAYERFHGPDARRAPYAGRYPHDALDAAARRLRAHLAEGRDVFAYFNNDIGGAAVDDALALRRALGGAA